MDNTMNFSYMTRLCHDLIKNYQTPKEAGGVGFYDKLLQKSAEDIANGVPAKEAIVKNMSMEEYKVYLYDKIAALSVHESNMQDSVSVHITDAGLEAMKNDPEYEKWVLDTLKTNFQYPDPWSSVCGGKFSVFYFGATKEECHGESWRLGYRNGNGQSIFNEKAEDSFWERRQKRRKEWLEQLEKLEEKKALSKRMARTQYFAKLSAIEPDVGSSKELPNCDMLAMQIFSSFKANILLGSFQGKKG